MNRHWKLLRHSIILAGLMFSGFIGFARGESFTGVNWIVHFNLPDQDYYEAPGEYVIRDALLARINALQAGQTGTLATFTFSAAGTAGSILSSMQDALNRGATVKFIADYAIDVNAAYDGLALTTLTARTVNPLILSRATNSAGIMHHKFGLFDYGKTNRWLLTGSWNFTSKASYGQWNVGLEMRNADVFSAYGKEAEELLAGRFHYNTNKSHAANGSIFNLDGAWGPSWVDFAPYPTSRFGGSNAQTEVFQLIDGAQSEIVFALNKLNRPHIRDALLAAADRGVHIVGVIPKSDRTTSSDTSYDVYTFLSNPDNYATTNRIQWVDAYSRADYSTTDAGELDLVHEKWMVIDPWTDRPVLIAGSANWTDSALSSTTENDENILFLRHRDIARLFYMQFKRMTGLWQDQCYSWMDVSREGKNPQVVFWITDTNRHMLATCDNLVTGNWTDWEPAISNFMGRMTRTYTGTAPFRMIRLQ